MSSKSSEKSSEKRVEADALASENAQLKDENANLRYEKDKIALGAELEIGSLKDEAEKLRIQRDQADREARQPLIDSLSTDSRGYLDKDDLAKLSVESLKILKRTFIGAVARDYADFLAERERKNAKRRLGTVGSYNQDTKEYEDGV